LLGDSDFDTDVANVGRRTGKTSQTSIFTASDGESTYLSTCTDWPSNKRCYHTVCNGKAIISWYA